MRPLPDGVQFPFTSLQMFCTDRGRHGKRELVSLEYDAADNVLKQLRLRVGKGTPYAGAVVEPDGVEHTGTVMPPPSHRPSRHEDYEGRDRWRLVCSSCARDVVLRHERLEQIVVQLLRAERRSVDVSYLPL